MIKQDQLLGQIEEANSQLKEARSSVANLKKQLMDAETVLIGAKIHRERLVEELRMLRNATINKEITDRQEDIERFRKILPELMEKIK